MRTFKVAFPLVFAEVGDTVTEEQCGGCQIDALIEAGFLVETTPPSASTSSTFPSATTPSAPTPAPSSSTAPTSNGG